MDSTLKRRDLLLPQHADRMGRGTAMAVLAHALLIVALAFGVSWRSQEPAGVSAELWAATPQIAAPPAVEPVPKPQPKPEPPPPPKAVEPPPKPSPTEAQIAIEKEKARKELERKEQERLEREKLEREKAEKLAAQKERENEAKRQKEEERRLAKQRDENLKRMMGEATGTGSPSSTGTAAREAGPSASYAGRIKARIKPNIVLTDEVPGNPTAEVEVRCGPDGTIIGRRLVKSSGQKAWDDAVLRAIDRTEVLPRDVDGRVPSTMVIEFRPRE
ncbi:MAG: cell envelope integrity protein TolA [Burkholderiaceae bacterium]